MSRVQVLACEASFEHWYHRYVAEEHRMALVWLVLTFPGHVDRSKTTFTPAITEVLSEKHVASFTDYTRINNAPEKKHQLYPRRARE